VLRDLITLVRRPYSALDTISMHRGLPEGLFALALSVIAPALISELGALGPFRPPANLGSLPSLTMQGADLYARWTYQHRFVLPLYGVVVSLALWVVAAAVVHGIARSLGGRGSFLGYLKLVGYVALVGLVILPFGLFDALARLQGSARVEASFGQLLGVVGIAVLVWQNVLLVYAARLHYRISTGRAVAAVIGPIGVIALLALALLILAVVLLVVSQQSL
jgi:hypothetical protein